MARFYVDAWDPGYGSSGDADTATASTAPVRIDVEVPADSWHPLVAPAELRPPDVVLLVDGVRRIDARIWREEDDGTLHPGVAASYAAGVVRCDQRRGVAEVAVGRVERGLFTPSHTATDITIGSTCYTAKQVNVTELAKLSNAVLENLRILEIKVSEAARAGTDTDDDLLIVDGPLEGRNRLPRALGHIKTHPTRFLAAPQAAVIAALRPGQRTPFFELGSRFRQYSWYLRLPGPPGSPWSGIVRVECSADLPVAEVTRLADLSVVTLPRFASSPYKDTRAPQNLIPIGGLERRLRSMLGNAQLLQRGLISAAARG